MTDPRLTKRAVEHAEQGLDPALDASLQRLMTDVPDMVGEARRCRAAASVEEVGLLDSLVPLAWRALPRLSATAALSLLVAAGLFFTSDPGSATLRADSLSNLSNLNSSGGVDQLILTGSASGDDPLLQAIVGSANGESESGG